MRALFVINGLGTGGAERSLAELLLELPRHGWDASVAVLHERAEGVEESVRAAGVPVHVLHGSFPRQLAQLRGIIRRKRPQVVHSALFDADVLSRLAALGTGAAHVSTLVNTSYDPARLADHNLRRSRVRAVQAVDGFTARHGSAAFIALTETVKAASVRDLGIDPDRVSVIGRTRRRDRLGEPSAQRRAAVRARLDVAPDAFVAVNVGRQEWQKGQVDLLAAAARLRDALPELLVVVAGRRGNASGELDAAMRQHALDGTVRFLGHIDDVGDLLAAADVFVFPSRYEGLGGALIEAMALGLPIVASDIAVIREVVDAGGNADLVPPNDGAALADAIRALAGDEPWRVRYAQRSRELFEAIAATPTTELTLEVFTRAISKR